MAVMGILTKGDDLEQGDAENYHTKDGYLNTSEPNESTPGDLSEYTSIFRCSTTS
jgi:hypothetical protein